MAAFEGIEAMAALEPTTPAEPSTRTVRSTRSLSSSAADSDSTASARTPGLHVYASRGRSAPRQCALRQQHASRLSCCTRAQPPSARRSEATERRQKDERFVGAASPAEAEARLCGGEFVLYYPRAPELLGERCTPPTELRLTVAYKASDGRFRHYEVRRRQADGDYYVDCGDERPPAFSCLHALVDFHKTFAFLLCDDDAAVDGRGGAIDVFPVWLWPNVGRRRYSTHASSHH